MEVAHSVTAELLPLHLVVEHNPWAFPEVFFTPDMRR